MSSMPEEIDVTDRRQRAAADTELQREQLWKALTASQHMIEELKGFRFQDKIELAESREREARLRKALETHRHTWGCVKYSALTGKAYCIQECADSLKDALSATPASEGESGIPPTRPRCCDFFRGPVEICEECREVFKSIGGITEGDIERLKRHHEAALAASERSAAGDRQT